MPERWQSLKEGGVLRIRDNEWRVIVVQGHAPGHALLYSPAMDLLIAGDQILPGISSNVSDPTGCRDATPLAEFLDSNRRVAQVCGDILVLPSHGHALSWFARSRSRSSNPHHEQRLQAFEDALTLRLGGAADLLPHVFGSQLSGFDIAFALGETIAHLQHLVNQGRALQVEQNGLVRFSALLRP